MLAHGQFFHQDGCFEMFDCHGARFDKKLETWGIAWRIQDGCFRTWGIRLDRDDRGRVYFARPWNCHVKVGAAEMLAQHVMVDVECRVSSVE